MGVTFIALALLACAWAVLLVPDLRNRGGSGGRANSVESFRNQLSGLDRTRPQHQTGRPGPRAGVRPTGAAPRSGAAGAPRQVRSSAGLSSVGAPSHRRPVPARRPASSPLLPRSRAEAAQRRLLVLGLLAGVALLTLIGALVGPRLLLLAHLVVDALLAGYAFLLWERASRTRTRHSSLVTLSTTMDDDDIVVRRQASGS